MIGQIKTVCLIFYMHIIPFMCEWLPVFCAANSGYDIVLRIAEKELTNRFLHYII